MTKETQWKGTSKDECQALVDHAINRDPTVKFLFEKLNEVRGLRPCHRQSHSICKLMASWALVGRLYSGQTLYSAGGVQR